MHNGHTCDVCTGYSIAGPGAVGSAASVTAPGPQGGRLRLHMDSLFIYELVHTDTIHGAKACSLRICMYTMDTRVTYVLDIRVKV